MTELKYNNVKFLAAYGLHSQLPPSENREFVFCGRSNVGKSTLINKVFNRKNLARTSSTPGKTATINFYQTNTAKGERIDFVDLPGYGYAKASKDEQRRLSELLDGYFSKERLVQCVFLLIDSRRIFDLEKINNDDLIMINYLAEKNIPFYAVFTKSDKLNKTEKQKSYDYITNNFKNITALQMLWFSGLKNEGIEAIQEIINSLVDLDPNGD
ncbi:MAG: ribosome biogenesis GTP-binding protein YihA/YsxC [Oscillospiraceae bacterium]|jgi:GTP-binding protein|nr:ribosome biogenesis GTP-binding protein YihA/YsxC [Oscillospiraceae bacterium]